jgi:4-hydroxy-tetrahydrodipicolinate reductase
MAASQPVPIMVIDLTGKMGNAVAEAVVLRGGSACTLVPVTFSGEAKPTVDVSGVAVEVQSIRDGAPGAVLEELMQKYPGMIVVDYTLPAGRKPQPSSLRSRQVSRSVHEATPGDRAHHSNMPPVKPAVDPGSRRR